MTVNQCLDVDQYPLPKPTELFATLPTGRFFSKLDLSQAYQQMLMEEESAKYLTINARYSWSGFGLCNLPEGHGSDPAGYPRSDMLYRRHPGEWLERGGATAETGGSLKTV